MSSVICSLPSMAVLWRRKSICQLTVPLQGPGTALAQKVENQKRKKASMIESSGLQLVKPPLFPSILLCLGDFQCKLNRELGNLGFSCGSASNWLYRWQVTSPLWSLSFGFLSFQHDKQEASGGELGLDQCFSILVAREHHLGSLKITDSQVPPAEILICLVVGGHPPDDSEVLPGLTATTLGESRVFLWFFYPMVLQLFKKEYFFLWRYQNPPWKERRLKCVNCNDENW